MAYTMGQYEALQAAIAEGALTVKYQDKLVTYRSLDEMLRIANLMAIELGINTNPRGRIYAQFGKGF